jgi:plasmid stabilization system protein ParE
MKYEMLSVAKSEFKEAVFYYNNQREGLGFEFGKEFKDALLRIVQFPEAWPRFSPRTRRCLLKRFPYAVLYQIRDTRIIVIAVMHMSRNPEIWNERK